MWISHRILLKATRQLQTHPNQAFIAYSMCRIWTALFQQVAGSAVVANITKPLSGACPGEYLCLLYHFSTSVSTLNYTLRQRQWFRESLHVICRCNQSPQNLTDQGAWQCWDDWTPPLVPPLFGSHSACRPTLPLSASSQPPWWRTPLAVGLALCKTH